MTNRSERLQERGIALVVVMFCLLLLSVIGLGMMYSTNMETAINTNYRDKQTALYAALAGLQEARDRIQPTFGSITPPADLPGFIASASAGSAGVIYIISDSSVDPTDPDNEYFDTELCQEKVLGLTGTAGIPCTAGPTVPGGQTWHRAFIDDSQSANAPWNLATPFETKWTRISLKGNNMTPVEVDGNSATSTQVCWDGANQILLPSGYGSSCGPNGSVTTITITNAGSGYTSTPTVTIGAPASGGTQATATASLITGQVATITITTGGSGYNVTDTVNVILTGGGGTGAAATATLGSGTTGAPVQSLTLTSAGTQCYTAAPSVSITGGGGLGATATATLGAFSCVYSWAPTVNCGNPWKGEEVRQIQLTGGSGSGFRGTVQFHSSGNSVNPISIQEPGDYTAAPTGATGGLPAAVAITGSCPFTPNVTLGKRVSSLTLTNGGSGYTAAPTVTIGPGIGTAASVPTATATLGASTSIPGGITAVTVTSPGTGYITAPAVTFSGGSGTGAVALATLGTSGSIQSITIDNGGSGYTSNPTITIGAPGAGTTATATSQIGRGTNYGKVYLLTSLAQTVRGARSMAQMEVATPVLGYSTTGALTLAGPNPMIGTFPNSTPFQVQGADLNSCSEVAEPDHPAIAGYDDPNADPPTNSVATIISELPRPENYTGAGGTPSVQNGYDSLGETMGTPTGLRALLDAIHAVASDGQTGHHLYGNNPGSIQLGTLTNPVVVYVDGDLTLNNLSGYGILVVTGRLEMGGNFSWAGPVLVVGDGEVDFNGGGNGVGGNVITGTLVVAKIWDDHTSKNLLTSLGSPEFNWDGGGGNGVRYDHCWADNLMNGIPFTPPNTTRPLKVLSFRLLPY